MLSRLSTDVFAFEFRPMEVTVEKQLYFENSSDVDWPFYDAERVLLFSGGLDSLAGAAETASAGNGLVLVSHRPVSTQSRRQRELFAALRTLFPVPMIHVPVWINKDEAMGREPSQRTRSFLYCSLGAIVAASVRAGGVRFFENGIVSLNLPVADEVLRARSSRTTHPQTLDDFRRFFSLVLDRELAVDNPYIFFTKTEVVERIVQRGASRLVGLTCSCAHQGLFQSKTRWHCGTCSQCIDRRVATLAAGLRNEDTADDYVVDVFSGPRKEGYERNMAVNYVRHGVELARMSEEEIATRFNLEFTRACRPFSRPSEAAQQLIEMHMRHGTTVQRVVSQELEGHLAALIDGSLDDSSLLAMTAGRRHVVSLWKGFARRIVEMLQAGLPRCCQSEKPKNEPRLQEICDGILCAQNNDLLREFPLMKWGSTATKPDWSAESLGLWVELKYVREKRDVARVLGEIAQDITKYGDNQRRVLYVVYDPGHLVSDEAAFMEPMSSRPEMELAFVR
jgi:7-cyano-7-deazaguanine synthase in queuosine biosynthesis